MSRVLAVPVAVSTLLAAAAFLFLWLDRRDRGLVPWLAGAAAWAFGVPAAVAAAAGWLPHLVETPSAGAPFPEAWLAAPAFRAAMPVVAVVVPLAVAARSRILDGPSCGAVFGTVAGLAFSLGAYVLVAARAGTPPAPAAAFVTLLHAAAGATLGAGVGLAKLAAPPGLRAAGFAGAAASAAAPGVVLVPAALAGWHRWGDSGVLFDLALAAAAAAVVAGVLSFALAFERKVVRWQLAEEVRLGVLPEWVVEVVPNYCRRVRSDWWGRDDERREIVRLLLGLAFQKRRLRNLSADRVRLYGLEVGRLRQRARVLLALPPAPAPGSPAGG